jgi:hypothetical protein
VTANVRAFEPIPTTKTPDLGSRSTNKRHHVLLVAPGPVAVPLTAAATYVARATPDAVGSSGSGDAAAPRTRMIAP